MILPITKLLVCIVWAGMIMIGVIVYVGAQRMKDLDRREVALERYANQLDTWERDVKVRRITVNGMIRYARRLADLDPRLAEQMEVIAVEMFNVHASKPLCAENPDCERCEISVDCGGQELRK